MGQYSKSSVFGISWTIAKRAIIEGVQKEAGGRSRSSRWIGVTCEIVNDDGTRARWPDLT
jgi:hypothetical protein